MRSTVRRSLAVLLFQFLPIHVLDPSLVVLLQLHSLKALFLLELLVAELLQKHLDLIPLRFDPVAAEQFLLVAEQVAHAVSPHSHRWSGLCLMPPKFETVPLRKIPLTFSQRVQSDFQVGRKHAVAEVPTPVLQLSKFAVPTKL